MTNTRVILLVIVHSVVHAALAGDADIVFNVNHVSFDDYTCVPAYRPIALEDTPMFIRVYVNSSTEITGANCFDQYNKVKISQEFNRFNTFITNKQLKINDSGKAWTCNFYTFNQKNITIQCATKFHIRTLTPVAQIYLNSNEVNTTHTPLDVREYDATKIYYFKHGETVLVDCKHSLQTGYSSMKYFNNTGGKLLETFDSPTHVAVHIKLTQESHSNYVDCYYKNFMIRSHDHYEDVSVSRIFFKLQIAEAVDSIITLHINGMYVRPTGEVYEYVYYAGDTADISCESRREDHLINLDYDGNKETFSKASITIYLDEKKDKTVVSCTAIDKDKDSGSIETVKVKLIRSLSDFYITGLNKANILQQYPETEDSSVIYYQFMDNETLILNCLNSKNTGNKLGWTFNESSIASTEVTEKRIIGRHLALVLKASYDNLTIKCILEPNISPSKPRQIVIRLAYKSTPVIVDEDSASTNWFWITSGIIMIVITIIILYNVRNYKNKRNERQSSDLDLVNLSDSRESPLRQWDETNFTELTESEIYNEPVLENITKNYRNNTSNNVSDNNYANVNNTYRNVVMEPALNYATISKLNNKKTDTKNNSRVRFTDTNTSGSNYENTSMIQGPSYVNSHFGDEPVEHIYCEVR